jgi:hypothetical protein
MRIGLIQTRGIGDIIIALPIANYLVNQGHEIFWPIDARFLASFANAAPHIQFRPVAGGDDKDKDSDSYFVHDPLAILKSESCESILPLYSFYTGPGRLPNAALDSHLKFDEYKYAVAGVPFAEKWQLSLRRNADRERALYDRLVPSRPYACVHLEGSDLTVSADAVKALTGDLPVVQISPQSDDIFDWLVIIERAAHLIMIDSCFSNLVEQLGLKNPKHLLLRSPCALTPVYKNDWTFLLMRAAGTTGPFPKQTKSSVSVHYSVAL